MTKKLNLTCICVGSSIVLACSGNTVVGGVDGQQASTDGSPDGLVADNDAGEDTGVRTDSGLLDATDADTMDVPQDASTDPEPKGDAGVSTEHDSGGLADIGSSDSGPPDDGGDEAGWVEAVLPEVDATGLCETSPEPPTMCEWVNSIDTLVWGSIVNLLPIQSPIFEDGTEVDDCDPSDVREGLIIQLEVRETLWGEAMTGVVEIRMGPQQLMFWDQRPVFDGGSVTWRPSPETLAIGSSLGAGLTYVGADAYLSLAGEMPFTFESDGAMTWPETANCRGNPVVEPAASYESLVTGLSTCSREPTGRDAGFDLRSERDNVWGGAERAYAAACSR